MPTSSGALMLTNSPRPSPALPSDHAVARSPSVIAPSLPPSALDADVARSTRAGDEGAGPLARSARHLGRARPLLRGEVLRRGPADERERGRIERARRDERGPAAERDVRAPLPHQHARGPARLHDDRGAPLLALLAARDTRPAAPHHHRIAALAGERPRDEQHPGRALGVAGHVDARHGAAPFERQAHGLRPVEARQRALGAARSGRRRRGRRARRRRRGRARRRPRRAGRAPAGPGRRGR